MEWGYGGELGWGEGMGEVGEGCEPGAEGGGGGTRGERRGCKSRARGWLRDGGLGAVQLTRQAGRTTGHQPALWPHP